MNPIELQIRPVVSVSLPQRGYYVRSLTAQYGTSRATELVERIETQYRELYARRPESAHKAMRTHIEVNILPALAFYQVLVDEGSSDEMAQEHLRRFYGEKTRVENKLKTSVFHWLPRRLAFRLLRPITRRTMNQTFNEPDFSFTWIEDTPERIAFHMTRCLYYNVLSAYDAARLTPIFCELDDVMFGMMEPAIHFTRSGTIGKGSSLCDFCWTPGIN